jgi:hypothetical protein
VEGIFEEGILGGDAFDDGAQRTKGKTQKRRTKGNAETQNAANRGEEEREGSGAHDYLRGGNSEEWNESIFVRFCGRSDSLQQRAEENRRRKKEEEEEEEGGGGEEGGEEEEEEEEEVEGKNRVFSIDFSAIRR